MKHGSLFSGIGGFDLGFERAGIETVWQVEIDDYCRRVLAHHFPSAQRYDDIRTVGKHNLAPVDILSGGFPCQDISNAGKRAGIDGERSGLWSEYARIIGELRPRYVVVENVAALLRRGMGRVLGDLAALGYDAEWQSIRASDVGAPHLRERIWIVAYPRRGFSDSSWNDSDQWRTRTSPASSELREMAYSACGLSRQSSEWKRREGAGGRSEAMADSKCEGLHARYFPEEGQIARRDWEQYENWQIEPDVGRVAHGVPARVDRLRGLGNAIIPQISEWIGRRIVEANHQQRP